MSQRRHLLERLRKANERIVELERQREVIRDTKHSYMDQVMAHAREIDILKPALQRIADHGYMSAKLSSPEELVHVMDWMLNTARAALEGRELPELIDREVR